MVRGVWVGMDGMPGFAIVWVSCFLGCCAIPMCAYCSGYRSLYIRPTYFSSIINLFYISQLLEDLYFRFGGLASSLHTTKYKSNTIFRLELYQNNLRALYDDRVTRTLSSSHHTPARSPTVETLTAPRQTSQPIHARYQ